MSTTRRHDYPTTMFAMLFMILVAASALEVPSVPSIDSGQLNTYMQDHGKPLFEQFARIRLESIHPGGASAVRDETVATTAQSMFARAANMDTAAQHKYLSGVHQRVVAEQ